MSLRRLNTLKFYCQLCNQPALSLPPKSEYCIIGLGVSRMPILCQPPGRGNANRFFANDYADRGFAPTLLPGTEPDRSAGRGGGMKNRSPARYVGSALCCIIWLL